jgi:Uri superfamily endonuclease
MQKIFLLPKDIANYQLEKNIGCYQLFLLNKKEQNIHVKSLGLLNFPSGYYIYTGSHKRFLLNRVKRHLNKNKKIYWHIDVLTMNHSFEIKYVLLYLNYLKECEINQKYNRLGKLKNVHPGFGNSDCKNGCISHLLYSQDKNNSILKYFE